MWKFLQWNIFIYKVAFVDIYLNSSMANSDLNFAIQGINGNFNIGNMLISVLELEDFTEKNPT